MPAATLGAFLKRNVWNISSTTLGVVGVALAVYFYYASLAERFPVLTISEPRTLVADADRTANSKIKVLRADGSSISGQVWAAQFYLWNAGKLSIRRSNVLSPIALEFQDESVELLGSSIAKENRPAISRASITNTDTNSLVIDFDILESRDVVVGQLLYRGSATTPIVAKGDVEGATEIASKPPIDWSMLVGRLGRTAGGISIIILLVLLALFLTIHAASRSERSRLLTDRIIWVAILSTIAFLLFASGKSFIDNAPVLQPPLSQPVSK